jgi:uncharacterized protein YqjF (DUF2071 family)/predicted DCC family thiol-disulfide oxidoreductase YuxK
VNTETTKTRDDDGAAGRVLYDPDCPLCVNLARRLAPLLQPRGFRLQPLPPSHPGASQPPDQMQVVTREGRVLAGADAVAHLAGQIGWARPLALFARLPGAMSLLRSGYGWIARHRYCLGGVCRRDAAVLPGAVEEARRRDDGVAAGGFPLRALLLADWTPVVFIHYEINPDILQPHVPLPLDVRDGKAYVSLVMFRQRNVRMRRWPWLTRPLFRAVSEHEFLNLRAYVRVGGERGIYFLSEWIPNRLDLVLGPRIYGLPYNHARIDFCGAAGTVATRDGRFAFHSKNSPPPEPAPCAAGSLAEFLLERYVAFTQRGGVQRYFRIWHEPWRQGPVNVEILDDGLLRAAAPWLQRARYVGAHLSAGARDVWIGKPRRLTPARGVFKRAVGWLPLSALVAAAFALRPQLPAWAFMWTMMVALFGGLKWLTWWRVRMKFGRALGYLLLWPGMEPREFAQDQRCGAPAAHEWAIAVRKTLLGIGLFWGVARCIPQQYPLLAGWVGMVGLVFLLHFGLMHVLALMWQAAGVPVKPIMNNPLRATSLNDFWSRRWNVAFAQLARPLLARLARRVGVPVATITVFLLSGVLHELVISVPARGGYGLPTAYFLLQGIGVCLERKLKFARGWLWTMLIVAVPSYWLFHPMFVESVILPMMRAWRAL